MIFDILWHWDRRELWRFRAMLIFGVVTPLVMIVVGVLAGMLNWYSKFMVCEIATIVATVCLCKLTFGRAAFAAEISAAIGVVQRSTKSAAGIAEECIRFTAGFITSVIVVGILLAWPDYSDEYMGIKLLMTVLIMISVVAVITHVIWQGGGEWWPKVAWWAIVANLILPSLALAMPRSFEIATSIPGRLDRAIACQDNPSAAGCPRPASGATLPPPVFSCPKGRFASADTLQAGEEKFLGTPVPGNLLVGASKRAFILGLEADGSETPKPVPQGLSSWLLPAGGKTKFRAVENDTKVCIAYSS